MNGDKTLPAHIDPSDWEEHVSTAVQDCHSLFERNGFFVLVDDHQVQELDEVVTFHENSCIRFIRLTPLSEG